MTDTDTIEAPTVAGRRAPTPLHTIATYVDGDRASAARLETAIALARTHGAHLSVMAFGYDPNIAAYSLGGAGGVTLAELERVAQGEAEARADDARARLAASEVLSDVTATVCTLSEVGPAFAAMARFADVAVMEQPYGAHGSPTAADAAEGALFAAETAVLACPPNTRGIAAERVLIGWDGGSTALRAVRRAMS
ncbi:MAG: hypothetical protein AAFZ09_07485, partial [Pseudomonadota bacterium]